MTLSIWSLLPLNFVSHNSPRHLPASNHISFLSKPGPFLQPQLMLFPLVGNASPTSNPHLPKAGSFPPFVLGLQVSSSPAVTLSISPCSVLPAGMCISLHSHLCIPPFPQKSALNLRGAQTCTRKMQEGAGGNKRMNEEGSMRAYKIGEPVTSSLSLSP